MSKKKLLLLVLVFIFGFILRLYKFDAPIADWHAWRQADTSAVSKFFVKDGFDVFHPRYYDLSNVPSGVHENPEGYRFVEFPIYNLVQAIPYKFIGIITIEQWGRLVTIFSSLFSGLLIFLIVKKYLNDIAALFATFFYIFIPYNIFYGRVVLPDPMTVTAFLAAIFFFDRWLDKNLKIDLDFFLALVFSISAFLLKPFAAFFMLPMLYLVYYKYGFDFIKNTKLWFFAICSILPFALWRAWMLQYPGGIPQSAWLINGNGIMLKGAFFQWIFAERIGKMILGYWGVALLVLGILYKSNRKTYLFFLSFLVSSLLYISVIATGNVQHDYYQILIMPSVAIFLGLGANYLWENKSNRLVSLSILFICTAFMLSFGWFEIRANYNIDHPELIRAGAEIDKLIPKDAKVIIPASGGDTTALYFMDRQGWSSFEKPLPQLIKMGADYMVLINPNSRDRDFGKTYKLVVWSSDFALYNLRQNP
ncbi:MAG: glycosyltransferase family 39 protein [Patescibacteria group bacterium]